MNIWRKFITSSNPAQALSFLFFYSLFFLFFFCYVLLIYTTALTCFHILDLFICFLCAELSVQSSCAVGNELDKQQVTTLHFRRTYFSLFRALLGGVPPETALEGKGPGRVAWSSRTFSSRHKSNPFQCTGSQTSVAEFGPVGMNLGLLMELKCKSKCTQGRSGCGLPRRNTETTAPVSETLENTARTQWIMMHFCLFSFSGEVNLLSENCLQSPLKKIWYLNSLINRMRLHRNWPLRISWQICLFILVFFLSFLFPLLFLWVLKAFFFPSVCV